MNRRRFLRCTAGLVAAGAVGTVGYTFGVEPHWVEVVQRPLPLAALPPPLVGRRLIQISDWHVGPQVDDRYLISGLGHLLQVRLNVRPEITVFTLVASNP